MRLKQKSSRNGLPNRSGSLDGCSQSQDSRAGRTTGGAAWSRLLNMQSVEEGIQEGNIESEDGD